MKRLPLLFRHVIWIDDIASLEKQNLKCQIMKSILYFTKIKFKILLQFFE